MRKHQPKWLAVMAFVFDMSAIFVLIFMIGGAAIFAVSQKEDKSFYGFRFYEVLTNSMVKTKEGQSGNFSAGDMVVVKVEDADKIQVGDIITFVPNKKSLDTHLTHRVIEKKPPKAVVAANQTDDLKTVDHYPVFITQGDANNLADPPVSGDLVIGVVKFSLPKVGLLIEFIRGHLMAVVIAIGALFGLLWVIRGSFLPEQPTD